METHEESGNPSLVSLQRILQFTTDELTAISEEATKFVSENLSSADFNDLRSSMASRSTALEVYQHVSQRSGGICRWNDETLWSPKVHPLALLPVDHQSESEDNELMSVTNWMLPLSLQDQLCGQEILQNRLI